MPTAALTSRELDAVVAEKIMGWTWSSTSAWSPSGSRWARSERDPWEWLPAYSTDILAAWEVIERVRGESTGIVTIVDDTLNDEWRCIFSGETWNVEGRADTVALAICLAALKTLGAPSGR